VNERTVGESRGPLPMRGELPARVQLPARGARPARAELPARRETDLRGMPAARGQLPGRKPTPTGYPGGRPSRSYELATAIRKHYRRPTPEPGAPSESGGRGRGRGLAAGTARLSPLLVLPLLLLFLLRHHHPAPAPQTSPVALAPASAPVLAGASTPSLGATLPILGLGNRPVRPVRLLIVLPARLAGELERSELPDLARWLAANERSSSVTRVLLTDGSARSLSPTTPAGTTPILAAAKLEATGQALRWLLARKGNGDTRIAVAITENLSAESPVASAHVAAGTVTLEAGAPVPSSSAADPARHDSVAAAVALRVLAASQQRLAVAPRATKR
jgi:hypothetical protein